MAFVFADIADGDGSCDICCAIIVLPAGITQIKLPVLQYPVGCLRHPVMNDGPVRAGP